MQSASVKRQDVTPDTSGNVTMTVEENKRLRQALLRIMTAIDSMEWNRVKRNRPLHEEFRSLIKSQASEAYKSVTDALWNDVYNDLFGGSPQ